MLTVQLIILMMLELRSVSSLVLWNSVSNRQANPRQVQKTRTPAPNQVAKALGAHCPFAIRNDLHTINSKHAWACITVLLLAMVFSSISYQASLAALKIYKLHYSTPSLSNAIVVGKGETELVC